MRPLSYDRQTINAPNPVSRFSHRARLARSIALAEGLIPMQGLVVDFGAGPGVFLAALAERRPDAALYAIEPNMPARADSRIQYVADLRSIAKADLICALEVCEHLSDANVECLLSDARQALKPEGRIMISVPIMVGPTLVLKELNRLIFFPGKSDYSFRELLRGIFGLSVDRAANREISHKGFEFRWLRDRIRRHFTIELELLSPLSVLPYWANSQVFFVGRSS